MATVNPKVKIQDTNLSEEDYIRGKYKWKTEIDCIRMEKMPSNYERTEE